jgi:hypothetical protein
MTNTSGSSGDTGREEPRQYHSWVGHDDSPTASIERGSSRCDGVPIDLTSRYSSANFGFQFPYRSRACGALRGECRNDQQASDKWGGESM